MARAPRVDVGGLAYHALNRANQGITLFEHPGDYEAFKAVVVEACLLFPMRILTYCLMPNHWHFVLWPFEDGDLATFFHWLTLTHTRRWHAFQGADGRGHLYQGRFKSIVVEEDEHLLTVCRYVERNPVRAQLAEHAADWRWGAAWQRDHPNEPGAIPLSAWPLERPPNWLEWVDRPQTQRELDALRVCIRRSRPFGSDTWCDRTAERYGLETTLRPRGRPALF